MHFVLVVVTLIAPEVTRYTTPVGPVVTMQEFDSQKACQLAQGIIRQAVQPAPQNVFCVPKGDEK